MATIREVLYQRSKDISIRRLSKSLGISPTTVKKYIKIAQSYGYRQNLNDDELQSITLKVEDALYNQTNTSLSNEVLEPYKETIKSWLSENNMTHTQIHRLLKKEKVLISRRSISRFIKMNFPKQLKSTIHINPSWQMQKRKTAAACIIQGY